ncbi:MAG: porin [Candidatus Accumulibacter sp.]|jgi:predicted porin|nr:porin [Accumulibacter sp.]
MQKKIIALAVAGLVSGAAYAQTNVTLYGRFDVGYVYSKSDFSKFAGIENGPSTGGGSSRIGIRGEEALGNGLKAIFEAEWGSNLDVGQAAVNARWAYVGLSGNFGRVIAGRLKTPTDLYAGSTSFNGINGLLPVNQFRSKLSNGEGILSGARWDNSIGYTSPNFSGVEFTGLYSFGEKVSRSENPNGYGYDCNSSSNPTPPPTTKTTCNKKADVTDAGRLGLGVKYANGPLYLMAAYEQRADDDSVKLNWDNTRPGNIPAANNRGYGVKGWNVGGSYDFKVVKLYANYSRVKANHDGLAYNRPNVGSDKESLWSLGLDVPVSRVGTVSVE